MGILRHPEVMLICVYNHRASGESEPRWQAGPLEGGSLPPTGAASQAPEVVTLPGCSAHIQHRFLPSQTCGQTPDPNLLLAPTSMPGAGRPELLQEALAALDQFCFFAAGSVTSTPASAGSSSSWRGESTRAGTPGAAATPTTSSA